MNIPRETYHVFRKVCAIRGYTSVKFKLGHGMADPILVSGVPMDKARQILGQLESGEIAPVEITAVAQIHTDRWGNRTVMDTVNCPRCGKVVSVGKACGGRKRSRRGVDRVNPCLYLVSTKQGKIVCLHPRAEEFSRRTPWKEREDRSDLPLFDGVEIPTGHNHPRGDAGTQ